MEQEKPAGLPPIIFTSLLCLVLIRPFFSGLAFPVFEYYYEICLIVIAIITSCLSIERFKSLPQKIHANLPVFLLLICYISSTVISININNSIKELVRFISCLCVFFVTSKVDNGQKNALIKSIVLSASVISAYSIYQYFWGYTFTLDYLKKTGSDFLINSPYARDILLGRRAIGTFPSPNILGGYLIIAFLLALEQPFGAGIKAALCPVIIAAALILTKSLGAWLSITAVFGISIFIFFKDLKKHKSMAVILLILAVIGIGFIVINRWDRLIGLKNPHNPIIQRLSYWRTCIAAIKDHPFLGIGPGNFQEVFLRYRAGWSTDTRYAHNIFLQTWLETGLLGFIAMGLTFLVFIGRSFRKSKYIFLAGTAFIFQNLIDITYFVPEAGFVFWVIMGMAV